MKIILSNMCTALVGMLKPELGYFLVQRGGSFFSQRSRHGAPPDGHLRFIFLCAELAQNHLYISDIQVSRDELVKAVEEAGWCISRFTENLHPTLTAKEVLTFKQTAGL